LTIEYIHHLHNVDHVVHFEPFFDPQAHTQRGISFDTVTQGISRALEDGREKYAITSKLIMCFLRDSPIQSCFQTLEQAKLHKNVIYGIGLDSYELGYPPNQFTQLFHKAREYGFKCVGHGGEIGPPQPYIWQLVNDLHVCRVDHGIRCLDDPELVQHLIQKRIPLTVCPLSNVRIGGVSSVQKHPIKQMLDLGLVVSINSDDPVYFGGYLLDNYISVTQAHHLLPKHVLQLALNGIESSFLSAEEKKKLSDQVTDMAQPFLAIPPPAG